MNYPSKDITVRYPKDFIDRVKIEFPNIPKLHRALDNGKLLLVGDILMEKSELCTKLNIQKMEKIKKFNNAIKSGNLQLIKKILIDISNTFSSNYRNEINKEFKKAKRFKKLLKDWQKFYKAYRKK